MHAVVSVARTRNLHVSEGAYLEGNVRMTGVRVERTAINDR